MKVFACLVLLLLISSTLSVADSCGAPCLVGTHTAITPVVLTFAIADQTIEAGDPVTTTNIAMQTAVVAPIFAVNIFDDQDPALAQIVDPGPPITHVYNGQKSIGGSIQTSFDFKQITPTRGYMFTVRGIKGHVVQFDPTTLTSPIGIEFTLPNRQVKSGWIAGETTGGNSLVLVVNTVPDIGEAAGIDYRVYVVKINLVANLITTAGNSLEIRGPIGIGDQAFFAGDPLATTKVLQLLNPVDMHQDNVAIAGTIDAGVQKWDIAVVDLNAATLTINFDWRIQGPDSLDDRGRTIDIEPTSGDAIVGGDVNDNGVVDPLDSGYVFARFGAVIDWVTPIDPGPLYEGGDLFPGIIDPTDFTYKAPGFALDTGTGDKDGIIMLLDSITGTFNSNAIITNDPTFDEEFNGITADDLYLVLSAWGRHGDNTGLLLMQPAAAFTAATVVRRARIDNFKPWTVETEQTPFGDDIFVGGQHEQGIIKRAGGLWLGPAGITYTIRGAFTEAYTKPNDASPPTPPYYFDQTVTYPTWTLAGDPTGMSFISVYDLGIASIPEFSTITLLIAVLGALVGIFAFRRRNA